MVAFDLNQIQTDFIRYAKVNTRSDAGSTTVPTTPGQTALANMLVGELQALGLTDAASNPANGFVTATIPATTSKAVPSIGGSSPTSTPRTMRQMTWRLSCTQITKARRFGLPMGWR